MDNRKEENLGIIEDTADQLLTCISYAFTDPTREATYEEIWPLLEPLYNELQIIKSRINHSDKD